MPVIKGSERLDIIVDPTRLSGERRVFTNVIAASSAGMSYDPASKGLQIVHEPGTGYRAVSIEDISSVKPAGSKTDEEDGLAKIAKMIEERKKFHHHKVKRIQLNKRTK